MTAVWMAVEEENEEEASFEASLTGRKKRRRNKWELVPGDRNRPLKFSFAPLPSPFQVLLVDEAAVTRLQAKKEEEEGFNNLSQVPVEGKP